MCLMTVSMQLEYWKTDEDNSIVKEHRIIYADSTPYCSRPVVATTRHVRASRKTKHRRGPVRPKSHGIDVKLIYGVH